MKKIFYASFYLLFYVNTMAQMPGTWQQMPSLGNSATPRNNAVSFSIGNKGYIGTGDEGSNIYKSDFWEYDPATNSWTQKADFGGTGRSNAVGFSIGNKGYIGTGNDGIFHSTTDFWEYNPVTNAWRQRADFGGTARGGAVGFGIGRKGYIGTGSEVFSGILYDFWEYNPTTNRWTRKADFEGGGRVGAKGFNIDHFGYVGTGVIDSSGYSIIKNDFWRYNPSTDNWLRRADLPGGERTGAAAFSVDDKGYIGVGYNYSQGYLQDFWEYDQQKNRWKQIADFAGGIRENTVCFSIQDKGYIGTGFDGSSLKNDLWQYDGLTNSWQQKTGFAGVKRTGVTGFSIGNKGYIGTGIGYTGTSYLGGLKDFWEYDADTKVWTQKADYGGGNISYAVGFSISNKGYIGTGTDGSGTYKKDFWEYDPAANTWTRKTNFRGAVRSSAVGFSIGSKGYIGTGYSPFDPDYRKKDFWEFDPAPNTWTKKANFRGTARSNAVGFSIGTKGYIGTGSDNNYLSKKDFWEYEPAADLWTKRADFGGDVRYSAVGLGIGNKGYIGTGFSDSLGYSSTRNDFWEYQPSTDTWTRKENFGGNARSEATGFSIGNFGYLGFGSNILDLFNDWWQYNAASGVSSTQPFIFNATLQKKDALLKWQIDNVANVYYFNVLRSFDGVNFMNIAKQNTTAGAASREFDYTDPNVTALHNTKIYYRLETVDIDGKVAYSKIVELNVKNTNGINFSIYPNPAKNKVHINIGSANNEALSIRILDMNGKQVYTEKITSFGDNFNYEIDVSGLVKNIYTIQVVSRKEITSTNFVKE